MLPDGHHAFSSRRECAFCQIAYSEPLPNLFSFNSPIGACDTCRGFGRIIGIDLDLIIPDRSLSLAEGAVKPFGGMSEGRMEFADLQKFCRRQKIPLDKSFRDLTAAQQRSIVAGTSSYYGIEGYFRWLENRTYKMHVRVFLSRYRSYDACPRCQAPASRTTPCSTLEGLTIAQVYALNVEQALDFFDRLPVSAADEAGGMVRDEIRSRLKYGMWQATSPRPAVAHPVGRRGPARGPDLGPGLSLVNTLCAGRAQHRAAPRDNHASCAS
jgi:excinuclease ABC subunit A